MRPAQAARLELAVPLGIGLLAGALGAAGCSGGGKSGPPDAGPPSAICTPEAAAGPPKRLSEDAAGLVSQRALGAVTPRAVADASGSRLIVYRDDIPTGAGDIVVRRAGGGERTFGSPQILSETRAESAAPDVALAGQVAVVVWVEADGEAPGLYARVSNDAGQTFQPPVRLSPDAGPETRPRVAIDAAGRIVVLWDGARRPSQTSLFPTRSLRLARSSDGGLSFTEAPVLAEINGLGQPALAIAPSGRVVVVWAEAGSIEGGHSLLLVRSDPGGGNFSAPTFVAGEVTAGAALVVDPMGKLFLLWMPGTTARGAWEPMGVGLLRSTDDGATFADLGTLDTAPATGVWLAAGDAGLSMVWTSCPSYPVCGSQFSLSTNGGETRSPPAELTRAAPDGSPLALSAVSSSGPATVLAWGGGSGWFQDLFAETLDLATLGSGVSALTAHGNLSSAAVGAAASTPVVAHPGDGRIVVAWSQDANAVPSDHAGIFFSRSADGGHTFSPALRVAGNLPTIDFACRRTDRDVPSISDSRTGVSMATRGTSEIALAWAEDVFDPAWEGACWIANRTDVFVSRSTDGGQTFSAPLNVSRTTGHSDDLVLAGHSEDPVLAYDSRGGLMLLWHELVAGRIEGCSYASRYQIMGAYSQDGGATFSAPAGVSEQARPGFCGNASRPVLSATGNSLYAGWILHAAGPGITEVAVTRSVDGGADFSSGRLVTVVAYSDGFASALAARANEAGELWLVWRIGDALWLSGSRDAAQTFTAPLRIAESATSDGMGFDVTGGAAGGGWLAWGVPGTTDSAHEVRVARFADDAAPVATFNRSNNIGDSDWPNVAADRAGNALVVWQDDTISPGNASVVIACQPTSPRP